MGHVAVQRGEFAVAVHEPKQIGAHCHQVAGAARGSVEPPNQFLPPRLGSEMKIASVFIASPRAPALYRPGQLFPVRTEVAGQRLEECQPLGVVEMTVSVENLARYRSAGGLAPA